MLSDKHRIATLEEEVRRLEKERDAALAQVRHLDRYRTACKSIEQGFCIIETILDDRGRCIDYRFLDTSPTFERHTGLIDAVVRTARELVPDLESFWFERYGRVAVTGQPEKFVMCSEAMDRWYEVDAFRVGDPEQCQVGLLFSDITARKYAEQDLLQTKERLQSTIDSITDGLLIIDREWRYTYFSEQAAKIVGVRREDMEGGVVWDLYPHAQGTKFYDYYHRAMATGQPQHFEEFYPEPLNQWLECHCYPREEGLTVYFRDVTEKKLSEESRQRAYALLDGIAAGTDDMIAAEDGEFRYLYFNDAYRREIMALWGREIEVGTSMIEALAPWPEEQRKARELWGRALAGESFRVKMEFGSEQERRIYNLHFNPVKDAHGRQLGAAHIVRDVTDQVRMQQALAESEEHARRIIDNTVALVGVMTPDGTLIEANATALRAGGLRREDVVGKKFWDCYWWSYDFQIQQQLREAVAKAARGEIVRYDVVVRTGGDGRMPIDFMIAPARNSAGQITHLIPSALDITERKRAEDARRLMQTSVDGAADMIAWFTPDGRVHYANDATCRTLGYSRDELLQMTALDFSPGFTWEQYQAHWQEVREHKSLLLQPTHRRKDGSEYTAEVLVNHVVYGGQEYIFAYGRDITERKRAEKALEDARAAAEEASRVKSEFLANMSHEIRTPMTVFLAAIEYLLQIDRSPERRKLLDMADQSARRLRTLIDDILDFSRIEARKVEIEEEPFDLRQCVRKAVAMFDLPAREKNLRLETEIAAQAPCTIVGDPGRLGQVLINLIGNAVKFTHQGEIRVRVQPQGSLLEFSVSDTGIGIPEDKYNLLFEHFSQVDSSFTRQYGGSGLGLAISKGLVELMGGEISVRSREGRGSTFFFTVPFQSPPGTEAPRPESAPENAEGQLAAARILLADDEPMIRQMIAMMLAQKEMPIEVAETGRAALEKWTAGDFDIILMDLQRWSQKIGQCIKL